jgi:hypothetical protein
MLGIHKAPDVYYAVSIFYAEENLSQDPYLASYRPSFQSFD